MNYFWMFLSGLLGVFIYAVYKMNRINSREENYTFEKVVLLFLKKEAFSLILSLGAVAFVMILVGIGFRMKADGKPLPWAPAAINDNWVYMIHPAMFVTGIAGAWALISLLNVTEKYIKRKEDEKTRDIENGQSI